MTETTFNDTVSKLASMTDPAQFERLVTATLRSAKPDIYENLSHPGVNTSGKTVKSPFDSLGWTSLGNKATIVGVEHTITNRNNLEGKWLHDPSTVKPKKGRQPTQPAGDLTKAIDEVKKLRESQPELKAIVVLTCNCEEPANLRAKAESLASKNDVKLDIWSVSRIAQYLDINPEGQIIRYQYFGSPITHLSKSELLRIGKESLGRHQAFLEENEVVTRDLPDLFYSNGDALVSGASGMGKTTVCFNILTKAFEQNQLGLVLSDQTISEATSLENALSLELKSYSQSLIIDSGKRAIELSSVINPLIIVVEDINKSTQPEKLLNKIITWISQKKSGSGKHWRILCPVWPQHLTLLDKKVLDAAYKANIIQTIGLYNDEEANRAVKLSLKKAGVEINELSVDTLGKALGNDPLLVGLHDYSGKVSTTNIVPNFIEAELDRIATSSVYCSTDLEDAISTLMLLMLEKKNLNPSWREVKSWSDSSEFRLILRTVFEARRLLYFSKAPRGEVVESRHDRILYYLLAQAVAEHLSTNPKETYLSDPYFSEIIGMAFVIGKSPPDSFPFIMESNPVSVFYALKYAIAIDSDYSTVASDAIESWIKLDLHRGENHSSKRYLGLTVLAEIDSDLVINLTSLFPSSDKRRAYLKARFRNGDIKAGCAWLTEYPFGTTVSDHPKLIEYIHQRYRIQFVNELIQLLQTSKLHSRVLQGALLICGYIADPILANSVRKAWSIYGADKENLKTFFWAASQVCDDNADSILGPMFDKWERLSDKKEKHGDSEITSFAAYGLSWKLRDYVPKVAIPYIVEKAQTSIKLEWPITYMLRGVDHPIALQYQAKYLANLRMQSNDGMVFHSYFVKDEWSRISEDYSRLMSIESKACLLDISADMKNDKYLREEAFRLWEVSIHSEDLTAMKSINKEDIRFDDTLWARARRQDRSVIPDLIKKIEENPRHWWQCGRYIWTRELTATLAVTIKNVAYDNKREEKWMLPELLSNLDTNTVEELLTPYWDKLSTIPQLVQIALNTTNPALVKLAQKTIKNSDKPEELLQYYTMNIGIKTKGRDGITKLEQLRVLQPFFGLLSDSDLHSLWEVGRDLGWNKYIEEHMVPVLESRNGEYIERVFKGSEINFSDLESDLKKDNPWHSYHWFESVERHGWNRDEIFSGLIEWLEKNKSIPALKVAGAVISHIGDRTEYYRLEGTILRLDLQDTAEVLDKIRFEVFSRTLI